MQIRILACVSLAGFAAVSMAQRPQGNLEIIKLQSRVTSVAISAASNRAVAVTQDRKLTLWDIANGRLLQTIPLATAEIDVTAISDDGRSIFTGDHSGNYVVWEASTGKAQLQLRLPHYASAAAFSHDSYWIAIAPMGDPVQILDLTTSRRLYQTPLVAGGITALAFSRDGSSLATADADTAIRIYETRTGKLVAENRDFLLEPLAVDFTPDGRQVIAGGADKVIAFIDAATGKVIRRLQKMDEPVSPAGLKVSPDGSFFAALLMKAEDMNEPAPILVWNASSGHEESRWMPPSLALYLDWTRDGRLISVGPDSDSLRVFRVP